MDPTGIRRALSEKFSDEEVIAAWEENAAPWTDAVRERKIESRNLVTDAAIISAVLERNPKTLLDLGCGEGWLTRKLSEQRIKCTGVDAIPELIERAKSLGGGEFRVASYEDIAGGAVQGKFDVVVANFSLIGGEAVDRVIGRAIQLLNKKGSLIVQTPHPIVAGGELPYEDGWREGSWAGCGNSFSKAAPWYFRTIETWVKLLRDCGLHVAELREPIHPVTKKPASLILIGESPQ